MPTVIEILKKLRPSAGAPNEQIPGLIEQGNIDLANRPVVRNADGSISTVRSVGVNMDGREILLPTVSDDGTIMSVDQAIDNYRKTGKHLGIFRDPASSNYFAKQLHEQQADFYGPKK